jgi:hypothetical protein
MKQTIAGRFEMVLRGIPYLFLGRTTFTSEKGNVTETWTAHVGPFVVGLNKRKG